MAQRDPTSEVANPAEQKCSRPTIGVQSILVILCFCAGIAGPTVARWLPDDFTRLAFNVFLTAFFLALTLIARRRSSLRPYWELAFAFFVLALVQVLYSTSPYFTAYILREAPTSGNPMASTVSGTIAVQLYETLAAIVPVVVLTRVSGRDLGSIYARRGAVGRWFVLAVIVFVVIFILMFLQNAAGTQASRLFPTNGPTGFARFVSLTPALLVLAVSNGFQEEFLLRCLFLQKYNVFFNPVVSNVLQAAIFATWHLGISYTPSAVFFAIVVVFPLGLVLGFLMRKTNGVVTPGIFHAGFDLPIYLAFLTFVS